MPSVAARDYRCSWEIPFDFHPRIHNYPGVTSVVRAYMDRETAPAAPKGDEKDADSQKASTKNNMQKTMRHCPLKPPSSLSPDTTATQRHLAKEPDSPSKKTRISCSAKTTVPVALKPKPQPRQVPTLPLEAKPMETADASQEAEQEGAQKTFRRRPFNALTSRAAAAAVAPAAQRAKLFSPPSPSQLFGAHPPPAAARSTYRSRTKPRYTLPPSYAAQRQRFEAQPVPTIHVGDRFTAPPSAREVRMHPRSLSRPYTRRGFVDELRRHLNASQHSSDVGAVTDVVPQAVLDSYTDAEDARKFDPSAHNFSAVVPDAFLNSVAERRTCLQATEQRMWDRMILDIAPMAAAHSQVMAAGGVSVLDSGHVSAPIYITSQADIVAAYLKSVEDDEHEDDNEGMKDAVAVVVQPFAEELPATAEALRQSEACRLLPRGREWDRQAALRAAVGPTAQEAIVDLGIDPRYRQPGDFLLRRNGA